MLIERCKCILYDGVCIKHSHRLRAENSFLRRDRTIRESRFRLCAELRIYAFEKFTYVLVCAIPIVRQKQIRFSRIAFYCLSLFVRRSLAYTYSTPSPTARIWNINAFDKEIVSFSETYRVDFANYSTIFMIGCEYSRVFLTKWILFAFRSRCIRTMIAKRPSKSTRAEVARALRIVVNARSVGSIYSRFSFYFSRIWMLDCGGIAGNSFRTKSLL